MKFSIQNKDLKKHLSNIKKSKAFNKTDDDGVVLKISVKEDRVYFTCSNIGIWACSVIRENIKIEEQGDLFVDGTNFINIVDSYPQNAELFFNDEVEEDGNNRLKLTYNSNKKQKQSAFLLIDPEFFEDKPPKEQTQVIKVNAKKLIDSAQSVGFASSSDEMQRWMWGVLIEIYSAEDISAYATDRSRIAWYDEQGFDAKRDNDPVVLRPVYSCLEPVLSNLKKDKEITIKYGENYTILIQDDQWHGIPNALESHNKNDTLPDWRYLHKALLENVETTLYIKKENLLQCIKTASYTSCKRYGLRFAIDTKEKEITLAVDSTEVGGTLKSYHKETYKIEDTDIEGKEFKGEIIMSVRSLKETISHLKSDKISFQLSDVNSPIIIHGDEKDNLKVIATGLE